MKLPVLSRIEVINRLKKFGFIATRPKGSQVRLEKYSEGKVIKLTLPLHSELKKGTLARIIKDAGLTLEEFLESKQI
jgi:predicted RNA binding protein YcfA (HicA-like mRNA interferase family)